MIKKISFIIPIYNTEAALLKKCVSSVLAVSNVEKEILLIDDGSKKEETKRILEELSRDNEGIELFTQPNQGPGAARNLGLAKATGDYICFVDSDDYIEQEVFSDCIKYINESNDASDIFAGYATGNEREMLNKSICGDELLREAKCESIPNRWVLWAKLYNKRLFAGLSFEQDLKYCEDCVLLSKLYKRVGCVSIVNAIVYNHVVNEESLCNKYNPTADVDFSKAIVAMIENGFDSMSNTVVFYYYLKMILSLQVFNRLNVRSFWAKRRQAKEILQSEPFWSMFVEEGHKDKKWRQGILYWLLKYGFYYSAYVLKSWKTR